MQCDCGRTLATNTGGRIACKCGREHDVPKAETIVPVEVMRGHLELCRENTCGRYDNFRNADRCMGLADPCKLRANIRRGWTCPLGMHDKAGGKWLTMPTFDQDPQPDPQSDRCVIVIAGGSDSEEQLELTGPAMKAYADKCGADFVALRGDLSKAMPVYNKFRAHPFARAYRQTLYLDTDILISDHAPSIFDTYPDAAFAAANEWETVTRNLSVAEFQVESDIIADAMQQPRVPAEHMPNAGVLLFTAETADTWKPPQGLVPRIWLYDQHVLTQNLQRAGTTIQWLGNEWHHSFLMPDFWDAEKMRDAYFIHLNGARPHTYRIKLMRHLLAGNVEPLMPPKGASPYVPWL